MKKSPIAFVMFFICGAYAATHLDTENRLWFNADVVKSAIVEFVPESKQQPVADLYQDLMDQTTGKISVDSLFKVCRKAGFNTYKYEGFTQCKSFIQKMLMDAEIAQSVDLNGFCPGLDEKGNNPNKLRSITEKTRIGDFCSSTNIRIGQVIFKPGYNCSCMASVCNPGFEFQGGACVTRIADGNGDCLREAYPKTSENNYLEKCKSFCEKKYAGRACKYTSVVMSHSTGQCICNPKSTEIDAAYESMRQAKEKQINNLKYYEVCDDHKGKSGGAEVCVEGVFNWVNVGRLQASGLAEEYARVRYKDTVHCDTVNIRTSWNDDYVKCTSMNSKRYYEFQFDDVKESIDSAIQKALVMGICKIHNVSSGISKVPGGYSGSLKCNTACTSDMTKTARVFGLNAKTSGNTCNFSGLSMNASDAKSKLAKIDGIDNYVFFHGIQIQGSQNVISQLRQYIKSTGKTVRTFDCNKNVGEIKNSLLVGDDDVLRCKLNGQPIDFVFDDFSESWLYVQEVGESKMQCIVSGGKFAGQECYGLTQKQCTDANAIYLKQNPGASGFRWDGKECVSIDANEAQFYDGVIQVGTGAIALVDCVVGTHLGCVLVMVETAGLAAEMTTGVAIENRAGEFLSVSTRCKKRDCAISTIQNAGHVLSVMGALDATSLDSVDKELARLVGYLEPEDLSGVSDGDWDAIVRQLGGDPEDMAGTALVWLNRIGLGAQFLSIGASGLRLTAQAITKLAGKGSRIGSTASTVARALDTTGDAARAANNASDAARAANSTNDAANATSDVSRAANNASDPLHANIDTVRNASNKNRARAVYHPDMYATSSASIQSKAQDIFQKLDNIDNMSDDELRALSRLMSEFDAEVAAEATAKATAAAADATRATTNAATDGARTVNTTADATRTTSRATNSTSDVARTVDNVSDATTTNAMTSLQSAKSKLYTYGQSFDQTIDDFLYNNGGYPASWRRADLTDAEFDVLRADLRSRGLSLDTDPEGFLRISRISDSTTNAAKTTSHATNATADAGQATTKADDVVDPEDTWQELYRKYAPRNQSLEDFKAVTDGNLAEMQRRAKHFISWDDPLGEASERLRQAERKLDDFWANNPQAKELYETDEHAFYEKYKETYSLIYEKRHMEDVLENGFNGNLSTLDPSLRRVKKNAKEQKKILNEKIEPIKKILNEDIKSGKRTGEDAQDLFDYAKKKYSADTTDKVLHDVGKNISIDRLDEVALLRANQIHDIIESDDWLKSMKKDWYNLRKDQKVFFAQELSSRLHEKNGIPAHKAPKIRAETLREGNNGSYSQSENIIYLDLDQLPDFEDFINVLSHESGHAIDSLAPNASAVGAQLQDATKDLYGKDYKAYRAKPTEQMSWKTGDLAEVANPYKEYSTLNDVLEEAVGSNPNIIVLDLSTGTPLDLTAHNGRISVDTLGGALKAPETTLMLDVSPNTRNAETMKNILQNNGFEIINRDDGSWAAMPIR